MPSSKLHINRMEKLADQITELVGSTGSMVFHTILFLSIFVLLAFDVSFNTILLFITTLVSFEAIYLSIFIQRSTNKQARRLEKAIAEIRRSTVIHSKRPLDMVVEEIDKDVKKIKEQVKQHLP